MRGTRGLPGCGSSPSGRAGARPPFHHPRGVARAAERRPHRREKDTGLLDGSRHDTGREAGDTGAGPVTHQEAAMFMRRRPLLRAAAVGGGAYMAGKARQRNVAEREQYEADQDSRISDLEQNQAAGAAAPPPAAAGGGPAEASMS